MCKHQYEYEGHRSFGDNIPGYAQGAYFPGDEPGTRCKLTGEACGNPYNDSPANCSAMEPTAWPCPVCTPDGWDVNLFRDKRDDTYFCPDCEKKYTLSELQGEYRRGFSALLADYNVLLDAHRSLEAEVKRLWKVIENISAISTNIVKDSQGKCGLSYPDATE